MVANFRPVALSSIACKVLENILCSAILAFLTTHNLITQQQHGFERGQSCQTNILLCLEKWTELIDSGKSLDLGYFDYAKAFDKVSHRLLLRAWLAAWLSDRKQRVVVGNSKSSWLPVVSGTTQGTLLGFLLFLIYINDLPAECSPEDESLIKLLADDTKAYQEISEKADQQQASQNIGEWIVSRCGQISGKWRLIPASPKSCTLPKITRPWHTQSMAEKLPPSRQKRISAPGLETTSPQPLTCTKRNARRWLKSVASGGIFPTSTRGRSVRSTIRG